VAMAFALDYPEKVISLCVADITPKNYLETPSSAIQYEFHQRILKVLSELKLSDFKNRKEVEEKLRNSIPEKHVRQFILKNLHRVSGNFEWRINVPVIKNNLEHIIEGVDYKDYLDRIPITNYPVLFIRGENSGYIQSEDMLIIKKMYPDSFIETIPNTTHFLHAEKPNEFVALLTKFLNAKNN